MAKVRRFENGLKLSIRARIVGLRLQDMDSMVGTALTIEREIEDARSTRDASVSSKRKKIESLLGSTTFYVATKKLHPYFQAHPIVMLTNLPLLSTIHKPNQSGRMARWGIELSEFGI